MALPERRVHVIGAGTPAPDHLKDTPAGRYVNAIRANFPQGGSVVILEEDETGRPPQFGAVQVPRMEELNNLNPLFDAESEHLHGEASIVNYDEMPSAIDLLNKGQLAFPPAD